MAKSVNWSLSAQQYFAYNTQIIILEKYSILRVMTTVFFCSFIDKYIYLYFPPLQLKAILCLFNWETIQEKRNEWFSKYEMERQMWLKSGFHKIEKIYLNVKILF